MGYFLKRYVCFVLQIHTAITAKEKLFTNGLERRCASKEAILLKQQYRLPYFQESLASTVQGILSRIQSSGDAELLVGRSALEATLRDAEKQPMLFEPEVQVIPKLIFNHSRRRLQDLVDALNKEVSVIDGLTCAENTSAEGRGLRETFVRWNSSFTIIAHDVQKCRRFLGGDLFTVELKDAFGNKKATGNVEDRGDGSYLATYTVPTDVEPSYYQLNVCLDGVHIHGSPF